MGVLARERSYGTRMGVLAREKEFKQKLFWLFELMLSRSVADLEGFEGFTRAPFKTKLFHFHGENLEKSGNINKLSGIINKSNPIL